MALGPGLSGVNPNTPHNLVLDCGILYKNIDIAALRAGTGVAAALAGATVLGATRGGATFTTNKESRQVEVDGLRFPIKGLERIDMFRPELTCTLIELTQANLQLLMGAHTTTALPNSWAEIVPDIEIDESDYIDNIALLATHSGSADELIVVLENVLMVEGMELPFEDKNELAIACTFRGHATAEEPQTNPFHIFYPPVAAAGGTEVANFWGDIGLVALTFSAALNQTDAENATFYTLKRNDTQADVPFTVAYNAETFMVSLTPTSPLSDAISYTVTASADLMDANGDPIEAYTHSFTPTPAGS